MSPGTDGAASSPARPGSRRQPRLPGAPSPLGLAAGIRPSAPQLGVASQTFRSPPERQAPPLPRPLPRRPPPRARPSAASASAPPPTPREPGRHDPETRRARRGPGRQARRRQSRAQRPRVPARAASPSLTRPHPSGTQRPHTVGTRDAGRDNAASSSPAHPLTAARFPGVRRDSRRSVHFSAETFLLTKPVAITKSFKLRLPPPLKPPGAEPSLIFFAFNWSEELPF